VSVSHTRRSLKKFMNKKVDILRNNILDLVIHLVNSEAELQVITGHRPKEPPLIFNKNSSIECLSIIAPRIFNTHVK